MTDDAVTEGLKSEYETLEAMWPTASDAVKVGILTTLEGLLQRSDEAADVELSNEIENTIVTIRGHLDSGRQR